jgi:hypothetical protein
MVHVGCLISHLMCVCEREAIWAGPDNALGGLGVQDLTSLGYALRLR